MQHPILFLLRYRFLTMTTAQKEPTDSVLQFPDYMLPDFSSVLQYEAHSSVPQEPELFLSFFRQFFASFFCRNWRCTHVVFRISKIISDGTTLICQCEYIIKLRTALLLLMLSYFVVSGTSSNLPIISAHRNCMECICRFKTSCPFHQLHDHIHIQDRSSCFIHKSYHRTTVMCRTMCTDINLSFKSLA